MDHAAVKSSPRSEFLDKKFGNYAILEHLGTGGMGDVYKAVHTGLDRTVALKILPPQLARSAEHSERFTAEAYAISRLQHQNIVTIYDYGEENGQRFIAMQFIQGVTLSKLVRSESPMDFARIINITKQICRGLKYAHENEVVHRDIKAGNIMMAPGDKAYISDFGIAKVVDAPNITTTGMALGTPEYMAPEQCEGGTVDAQSDLYALGVVIHEMTAGRPPFTADTPLAVAFKQVHEQPPLLGKVRAGVPPRLELIVAKCLKKKKEERYRNAEELLHDLDTVHLEAAAPERKTSPSSAENRITDRRNADRRFGLVSGVEPRTALMAALILLVAIAGLVTWQILASRSGGNALAWIWPEVRSDETSAAKTAAKNLWDADRGTGWSPAENGELALELGGNYALQALYLETGPSGNGSGPGFPPGVEIVLDGKKPLRYALEETPAPQTLLLQGRVARRLTLRFPMRAATPVLREARLLGARYE